MHAWQVENAARRALVAETSGPETTGDDDSRESPTSGQTESDTEEMQSECCPAKDSAGDAQATGRPDKGSAGEESTAKEEPRLKSAGDAASSTLKVPASMRAGMYIVNGSLFTAGGRLCVPSDLQNELIKEMHENDSAGHRGARKTLQHMEQRLYWP